MALNSSGPISLGGATTGESINLENGNSATAQVSLNDTAVRNLAGVASGAITMPTNFWGKSNIVNISYTFSSNTADAALNLSSISGYSAGKSNITVTVNSGVYLYATSTGSYGLNLSGGTTGDTLTIVNNGYIIGQGGEGRDSPGGNPSPGGPGGPALNLGFGMSSCTINNTNASAYIAGGGGGGGGSNYTGYKSSGGGGAGGGGSIGINGASPATGGGVGQSGSSPYQSTGSGGGGGRILPGVGGAGYTLSTPGHGGYYVDGKGGGAGASSGIGAGSKGSTFTVGAGGSGNSAGGNSTGGGGPGGGWGASAGTAPYAGGAGSGGKAVNLNGKTVTWTSGNTTRVYGSVS